MAEVCADHPLQTLRFYCIACDTKPLLCIECAYADRAHAELHVGLEEGRKALQSRVGQLKGRLSGQQEVYVAAYNEVIGQVDKLCDSGDDARDRVHDFIQQCRMNIDALEKHLLDMIQSKISGHCKILEATTDDIQTLFCHLDQAISLVKQQPSETTFHEDLILEKKLEEALKKVSLRELPEIPSAAQVRFIPEMTPNFVSRVFSSQMDSQTLKPNWIWLSHATEGPIRGWAPFLAAPRIVIPTAESQRAPENDTALKHPWGICTNPIDGNIYVADEMNHRISVFNPAQESGPLHFITELHGKLANPVGIAFDSHGSLAVCEYASHKIQVLKQRKRNADEGSSKDRENTQYEALTFGTFGSDVGLFRNPADVEFDNLGRLYVADYNNNRVQVYDFEKSLWQIIPCENHRITSIVATNGPSMVFIPASPQSIFVYDTMQRTLRSVPIRPIRKYAHGLVGPGNTLWLSDYERGCVHVYSLDDFQFVETLCVNKEETGLLHHPSNMCWGLDGLLYVCEPDQNRIARF